MKSWKQSNANAFLRERKSLTESEGGREREREGRTADGGGRRRQERQSRIRKRNAQAPFSNSSILLFEYVAAIVFGKTRFW
jgi:hypothetical protein